MINGKTILITGGTGTIGKYLISKLLECVPKRIIVFSRDEEKQFALKGLFETSVVSFIIGDIRDRKRLDDAMIGVNYVFHAAAMKQVPIAEENPYETTMTNVIGTYNVLQSAQSAGVDRVVVFSSDKAISPTNCMGMTKGICERLVRTANKNSKTIVTAVRLGNVIESRGSVLTVWRKQIKTGNKITLTSDKMTRFLITSEEVFLLAKHALQYGKHGEVVFSPMNSCKILDLARLFCEINNVDPDSGIISVGSRNGEKEFEEIYSDEEANRLYERNGFIHISNINIEQGKTIVTAQKSNGEALLDYDQLRQWILIKADLNIMIGKEEGSRCV